MSVIHSRDMMRLPASRFALVGALLALLIGCNSGGSTISRGNKGLATNRGFLVKSVEVDGTTHKYSVYIPREYATSRKWPAIVFLHGIGEAGRDGTKMLGVGLAPEIVDRVEKNKPFPFIAIFPQSTGNWKGGDRAQLVLAVMDDVAKHYSLDPDRITLTGLSTGGYGTWAIGADHKDRFAALVPMCAYSAPDRVGRLVDMPIWCFHNSGDWAVSSGHSKKMIDRLKSAGGHPKFTTYNSLSHDCWHRAYSDEDLYEWILKQRRRG